MLQQIVFPRWLRLLGLSLLTGVAALVLALSPAGCSGQKKANVALKPIDNGRAMALIERVIVSSGTRWMKLRAELRLRQYGSSQASSGTSVE